MTPQDPTPPPKRLARSATDRRLAGVAGGLARHFELDPSLVRIAFVVLALFGGIGIALYALVALVAPADEGAPALSGWAKAALAVGGLIAIASLPFTGGPGLGLLVLAALAVLVYRAFGGAVDPRLAKASVIVVAVAAALALGLGAGLAAAFGATTLMAGLVIAAGVALIAGGLLGGARWLILPALLLALPVSVVSAADLELEGGVGEREYRPASVQDVQPLYRLGAGELRLDLTDVALAPSQELDVDVRIGAGRAEVTVPGDVCVVAEAHAGVGEVDLIDRVSEGVDVDNRRGGDPAPGTPVVRLDLHVGAGELVVRRDAPGVAGCG